MVITDIENAAKQVVEFWKKQEISSPPNTLDDILHFEFSKSMQLPDDFRRFFMITNGMVNLFPNEFDEEGYLFYPLQELATIEDEFDTDRINAGEHCIIFANYMHKSWWYGVRFSALGEDYEIGIIGSAVNFKVIAQSLGEFIHLYMKDAPVLYEYS